jgi:RNA polymerase sigma factor (sigma-70 family)
MRFLEDQHYIKLTQSGDMHAFGMLVQKHQRVVYTLAVRMLKNPEEAQEAAQDTFIRVYQSLPTFEGKSKFTTWLYRIAYNECLARIRKNKQYFSQLDETIDTQYEPSDYHDALESMHLEERAAMVKKGIESLSPSEAVVLTLFYLEDQSIKEIATIAGMSESNVKVSLHRGRKHLAVVLQKLSHNELIGL